MFNSPLLDVAIGLVFIFLLYSLLATSVNEAIATVFGLRARMLKNSIVESMLANTPNDNRWISLLKGIRELFLEILKIFIGRREKPDNKKKIGDEFFDHPVIKNYGSSRIFPNPSYIPAGNFSTVLIDLLKTEFNKRLDEIAAYKFSLPSNRDTLLQIQQGLQYSADVVKIKEVLDYYSRCYSGSGMPPPSSVIDKETWQILQLHLKGSIYNIEKFATSIEGWFDDTMKRVSGWYKRQTQIILFIIGIALAITFNIDTIEISGKLSTDKDARDKLVQLATQAVDKYKDDPRVKKIADKNGAIIADTSKEGQEANENIFKEYQARADSIKNFVNGDLKKANNIVALGWGDEEIKKANESKGKKSLGFLLTAFAICMGAPFWFDLLNKLVQLRAAGKKEGSSSAADNNAGANNTLPQQPITLNVNTQTGEEAVG